MLRIDSQINVLRNQFEQDNSIDFSGFKQVITSLSEIDSRCELSIEIMQGLYDFLQEKQHGQVTFEGICSLLCEFVLNQNDGQQSQNQTVFLSKVPQKMLNKISATIINQLQYIFSICDQAKTGIVLIDSLTMTVKQFCEIDQEYCEEDLLFFLSLLNQEINENAQNSDIKQEVEVKDSFTNNYVSNKQFQKIMNELENYLYQSCQQVSKIEHNFQDEIVVEGLEEDNFWTKKCIQQDDISPQQIYQENEQDQGGGNSGGELRQCKKEKNLFMNKNESQESTYIELFNIIYQKLDQVNQCLQLNQYKEFSWLNQITKEIMRLTKDIENIFQKQEQRIQYTLQKYDDQQLDKYFLINRIKSLEEQVNKFHKQIIEEQDELDNFKFENANLHTLLEKQEKKISKLESEMQNLSKLETEKEIQKRSIVLLQQQNQSLNQDLKDMQAKNQLFANNYQELMHQIQKYKSNSKLLEEQENKYLDCNELQSYSNINREQGKRKSIYIENHVMQSTYQQINELTEINQTQKDDIVKLKQIIIFNEENIDKLQREISNINQRYQELQQEYDQQMKNQQKYQDNSFNNLHSFHSQNSQTNFNDQSPYTDINQQPTIQPNKIVNNNNRLTNANNNQVQDIFSPYNFGKQRYQNLNFMKLMPTQAKITRSKQKTLKDQFINDNKLIEENEQDESVDDTDYKNSSLNEFDNNKNKKMIQPLNNETLIQKNENLLKNQPPNQNSSINSPIFVKNTNNRRPVLPKLNLKGMKKFQRKHYSDNFILDQKYSLQDFDSTNSPSSQDEEWQQSTYKQQKLSDYIQQPICHQVDSQSTINQIIDNQSQQAKKNQYIQKLKKQLQLNNQKSTSLDLSLQRQISSYPSQEGKQPSLFQKQQAVDNNRLELSIKEKLQEAQCLNRQQQILQDFLGLQNDFRLLQIINKHEPLNKNVQQPQNFLHNYCDSIYKIGSNWRQIKRIIFITSSNIYILVPNQNLDMDKIIPIDKILGIACSTKNQNLIVLHIEGGLEVMIESFRKIDLNLFIIQTRKNNRQKKIKIIFGNKFTIYTNHVASSRMNYAPNKLIQKYKNYHSIQNLDNEQCNKKEGILEIKLINPNANDNDQKNNLQYNQWRKGFFQLREDVIIEYQKKGDIQYQLFIPLKDCILINKPKGIEREFAFKISYTDKQQEYILASNFEIEYEEWYYAIRNAIN